MLAGERPFTAPTLEGMLQLQMSEPIPDLRQRSRVSEDTQPILMRMTEKKPEARFDSYKQLGEALTSAIEADEPPTSTP